MPRDRQHPAPPDGLKVSGRALWDAVLTDYELDEHEQTILREACRTADLLDARNRGHGQRWTVMPPRDRHGIHHATAAGVGSRIGRSGWLWQISHNRVPDSCMPNARP